MAKTKNTKNATKKTDFTINGTYAAGVRFNKENVLALVLDTEDPAAATLTAIVTNEKTGEKLSGVVILDIME